MRWSPLVVVLAVSACFAELPDVPVESSSSSDGGSTSTGEPGATTMSPTGMTESDRDVSSGGEPTTGEAPEGEGLFACVELQPCAVWTLPACQGPCSADAAGTCVLERLRDRAEAALRVRQCDGPCTLDALLLRGNGSALLRRQRATVGADEVLKNYQAPAQCELRPPEFFAGCLESFSAECADPEAWSQDCGAADSPICG